MVDFNSIFAEAPAVEGPVTPKGKPPWMVAFDAKVPNPAESMIESVKANEVSKKPTTFPEIPPQDGNTQNVDNTRVSTGVDMNAEMVKPFFEQGLDMRMAIDASTAARGSRVDDVYNLAWDMSDHNPLSIITMADTDASIRKPSVTKLINEAKDRGLIMSDDEVHEAVKKIQEEVPRLMGKDWFQSFYGVKYNSAMDAMEEDTSIYETMTRDMYAYVNPLMDDNDRKRTSINNQIKAEEAKSIEDGRDDNKIAQLHMQLTSLGKTYTDPNGKVIDLENATQEEQDYVALVSQYMTTFSEVQQTDAKKLEGVFWEQYNFARAMDQLYDKDVAPWIQENVEDRSRAYLDKTPVMPMHTTMPDSLKQIVDKRRDAKAKLSALSKLFLANSSPADVKKGVKYYGQLALKGFATGLMGQALVSAVQEEIGPTERDMLDITQSIMYSKELPVTPEMERAFQRSVGEYATEGGSSIIGMLPLLSVAGAGTNALTTITGLKTLTTAWKAGNSYQKAAALLADMAIEEIKFSVVGFAPGGGIGDAAATRINPMLKFKNPIARGIAQFMVRPTMITSAMYASDVTSAMVQDFYSYKDFNDILSERFSGGGREVAGLVLANFMFAFGGGKSIPKNDYTAIRDMAKKHRAEGREADAFWLEQQVKIYEKQDKAAAKVYRNNEFSGKSEAEIFESMKTAEKQVMEKEAARLQIEMENRNLLERTVTPESLPIVTKDSKMRDSKGELIPYFHGTDNVFNRFSKIGTGISTGGKANSRSRRAIFFAQNPEAAKTFGANVEQRYLNFKKPFKMGNVRGLTDAKIAQIEKEGYDGIVGWERINGVKEPVAASIGTRGIIKGQDLGPFQSKNAESMRAIAEKLRNKKLNLQDIAQVGLPVSMAKFEKAGIDAAAKTLEVTGDVVESIEKGVATIKETSWYQKLSPELRTKFDPEIRDRLQKLLEEAKPEAVAKYDLERATLMTKEATDKYLPEFDKEGNDIASKHGATFVSDVKKPESIVSKKAREGLSDVVEIEDMVRGTIVANDMRDFNAIVKDLKKAGYDVKVKRSPDSKTGYRGVTATKRKGELGEEIQLHTQATLDAQRKSDDLLKNYRPGEKTKISEKLPDSKIEYSDETAVAQIDVTKESGGSTFTVDGRNLAGAKGKASVGIFPERTETVEGELTSTDLKNFARKNKDILNGNEDVLSIGTWKDTKTGAIILDIVATPSLEKAKELGKKYNQEAVFDLENMKEVRTGGTGTEIDPLTGKKYSLTDIPIESRIADTKISTLAEAQAESRKLFDEAYETFNDVRVGTSPAVTPLERKMRAMEMPVATQKELKKAWTESKQQLLTGIKDVNRDMKEEFKQFVKDMPLTGLGVPLRKAMLNKVNQIDFTKPKSLERAINYFDKIINDATFRYDAVQYYKGLTTLDKKTSNLDTNQSGILKAKAGPEYLPTRDKLETIRKNMLEGNWNDAQKEIEAIYDKYKNYGDLVSEISLEDLSRIEELSFHGLLNETNGATYPELQGANRTLSEVIKYGKNQAAAKRLVRRTQEAEFQKAVFDILNGDPKKPVNLDPKAYPNLTKGAYDKIMNQFDWVQTDSFFTFLDKLSKFDKATDPYQSILNRQLGGSVLEADQQTFKETHELYSSIQNKAKELFGVKSNWELRRNSHERTKKLHTIEYMQDGETKKMDITINQAYKKYMEFQDMSLEKSNDAGRYTKDGQLTDLGQKIVDLLPPEVKKWADWQLEEFYPMMYDIINPKYRELYGRDMPMGRNYSPIFVEGKGKESNEIELLANQNMTNTATNGSLKTRVNHANELKLMDGDKVLLNYVDKMIYFKNWSDAINLLNNTFIRNQNNRKAIEQNWKPMYNKVAEGFINDFTRKPKDITTNIPIFEKARNNFAVASLALKPTVFFAQVTAMPAYLEKVPTLSYAKEFSKFFTDPKGSWGILQELKKDAFWQQRYGEGWDRDVINAMRQDFNSLGGSTWNNWKNATMFMTKYGDMFTVITGGLPLYRHTYNQAIKRLGPGNERLAKAEALSAFAQATRESQQAGQVYDLSSVQRANSFTKLLTMYKTSPFQYHRKVTGAIRNLSYGRGDVSGNIKTMAIYHVILPQMFQMVGNGFKWDQDDQLRALAFGNINEIFVLGDLIEAASNAAQGLPFEYQLTPVESTGKSLQKAVKHITASDLFEAAEDVNMTEIWKAVEDLGNVGGDVLGLPVRGTTSIVKGVADVASGNVEAPQDKVMRILGWSEKSLEGGKGFFDSEDEEEAFLKLLNDTKNPTIEKARTTLPAYGSGKKAVSSKNNKTIPKF